MLYFQSGYFEEGSLDKWSVSTTAAGPARPGFVHLFCSFVVQREDIPSRLNQTRGYEMQSRLRMIPGPDSGLRVLSAPGRFRHSRETRRSGMRCEGSLQNTDRDAH